MKAHAHERPALRPASSPESLEQASEALYQSHIRVQKKHERTHRRTEQEDVVIDARTETPLHHALTDALNESIPPGPTRALLRMNIERVYGANMRGEKPTYGHAMNIPAQPLYAREALEHFQGIVDAIYSADPTRAHASANEVRAAAAAYATALSHLNEGQIHGVEHILMSHHFPEDV